MKKIILNILKYTAYFGIGILLLWLAYRSQILGVEITSYTITSLQKTAFPQELIPELKTIQDKSFIDIETFNRELELAIGEENAHKYRVLIMNFMERSLEKLIKALKYADYRFIGISLIISLLSHVSRAIRWKILIKPLGYQPRLSNTFFAVMIMYLTNYAIPRSGEVTRCGILKSYEKIPFTKLFGTVFIERAVDLIMLVLLLGVVLISQFTVIIDFFQRNVSDRLLNVFLSPVLWYVVIIGIIGLLVLIFVFRKRFRHTKVYQKISETGHNFLDGAKTILRMEDKWAFLFHSIFIYVMYFLMNYICFFAFEPTAHLGISVGLAVFVLSSLGMVAPAPGGLGTWHFMAIGTLYIYQVPEAAARAYAFAVHGAMSLLLILGGFISLLLLPVFNKNKNSGANAGT